MVTKRMRALSLVVALLAVFSLFNVAAAQELKGNLVIYTCHGEEMPGDFKAYFEEMYPGVTVHVLPMGAQNALDRAMAERNNPQADILWGGPQDMFLTAKEAGILHPYVPSFDKYIPAEYKDPEGYYYGQFLTPLAIAYNDEILTENDIPKEWDGLLDPKWKELVTIRYPLASGAMRTFYSAMIYQFYKEDGSPDRGFEWLNKLDANTKDYTSHSSVVFNNLIRDLAKLSVWAYPDIMFQRVVNGYPLQGYIPKSGTPIITDNIAILKGAPNLEAAKAFIEFVGTKQSAMLMAHQYYRIPVRTDMPQATIPQWMNQEIKPMDIDWQLLAKFSPEWMDFWDNNVRGRNK